MSGIVVGLKEKLEELVRGIHKVIENDESSLPDISVVTLFRELEALINPEFIEESLPIFSDGCQILSKKLACIESMVSLGERSKQILNFLSDLPWEESYTKFFEPAVFRPLEVDSTSISFLERSAALLDRPTRKTRTFETPTLDDDIGEKSLELSAPERFFDEKKGEFLGSIEGKLPCSMASILKEFAEEGDYFDAFSYILHLIFEGALILKKKTERVEIEKKYYIFSGE
ncbi:MAG: hypothetical protein ACTSU5_05970 [Promethearchaeota archaeon]